MYINNIFNDFFPFRNSYSYRPQTANKSPYEADYRNPNIIPHKILSDNKVSIRTFPNVAQKDVKNYDIYSFFIRPEDIDFYSQYIDVCEFFLDGIKNSETYYKIYAQDKKWFGDISEIIIGLTDRVDSRAIIGQFAKSRVKCGQKCLKGEPCNHCEKIVQLSELLIKANLLIDKK